VEPSLPISTESLYCSFKKDGSFPGLPKIMSVWDFQITMDATIILKEMTLDDSILPLLVLFKVKRNRFEPASKMALWFGSSLGSSLHVGYACTKWLCQFYEMD
jgi:hypothetical protein